MYNITKILVVIVGSALFSYWNFPTPWLLGALFTASILSLLGYKIHIPRKMRGYMLSIIGLQMGSFITLDILMELRYVLGMLLGLLIMIPLYIIFTQFLYKKLMGLSNKDSFFCAVPGLLSYIGIVAEEEKADLSLVLFTHSLRLLFLVAVLPVILIGKIVENPPILEGFRIDSWWTILQTALVVMVIVLLGSYLSKIKFIAPWLFIAVILSLVSSLGFDYSLKPSPILFSLTQILLGCMLTANINRKDFQRSLLFYLKTFLIFALSLLFVFIFSVIISLFVGIDIKAVLLAYSPGGLEAMILMSITFGAHPILVSMLHIIRTIYLSFLVPFMFIQKNRPK